MGEFARWAAGIAPSTASEHIARLADGGLLAAAHQGRHRYVRLAGQRTAQIIEDLLGYASESGPGPVPEVQRRSLREVTKAQALARARTCYDHLAGRLGVRITEAMTEAGLLDQASGLALTEDGRRWLLVQLGVDVAAITTSCRPIARSCLDWTERRPHLGGLAGAAICERFFAQGWISRIGSTRAVKVSPDGERALRRISAINVAEM